MHNTPTFESCFNNLIAHQYQTALQGFMDNYHRQPDNYNFLYGVMISYILQLKTSECLDFLVKERLLSSFDLKIEQIIEFIHSNKHLYSMSPFSALFNIGLLLVRLQCLTDAQIFFRAARIIEPNNQKLNILQAEKNIMEHCFKKGIRLYTAAAGLQTIST